MAMPAMRCEPDERRWAGERNPLGAPEEKQQIARPLAADSRPLSLVTSDSVSWRRLCNGFANRCLLYLRACPVRECSDFALSARLCMGSRLHANAAAYPPTAATILNPNTSTSRTMF